MKQYLDLLHAIKEYGTYKPAARAGMPGTQSLFGYQFRHDLSKGFPLLTTKKMFWKGVVVELMWFLRGDTNIKFLVDNGVNIWNEDAYNYYVKRFNKEKNDNKESLLNNPINFETFIKCVKSVPDDMPHYLIPNYNWGDCGYQYGKVWRDWDAIEIGEIPERSRVDQLSNLIKSLKKTPESRRHIVTAIDPAHENDLALYWCHAMFQFNCRPIDSVTRAYYAVDNNKMHRNELMFPGEYEGKTLDQQLDENNIPKYYLDCQLYQRSADVFLGVPFNIASYALLVEILAKICNMVPGEFIHTFGDVHIYDNHKEQVNEQLRRTPTELPTLKIKDWVDGADNDIWKTYDLDVMAALMRVGQFELENYNPQDSIKAELSTGLIK